MPSVSILSDNGALSGSAGLKTSGGNDGVLLLQTTTSGGTPTTAISISNTQVVTYTNQPTYTGGTANGVLYLNGSKAVTSGTALVFDGTNMGISVTPSAWGSSFRAMQIGSLSGMSLMGYSGAAEFGNNFYFDTAYRYGATGTAARYVTSSSGHIWYTAPSGTAGNAITFTQAMTLDASGNLVIGATSTSQKLRVYDSGSNTVIRAENGTSAFEFQSFSNDGYINMNGTGNIIFRNGSGATERARIDSSGNLLVGVTSSTARFHAKGSASAETLYRLEPTTNAYASKLLISSTSSGDGGMRYGNGGGNNMDIFCYGEMIFLNGTGNIGGGVTGEKMRIDSSGNLLVGTTSSQGKLTVIESVDPAPSQSIYFENTASGFTKRVLTVNAARNTTNGTYKYISCSISSVQEKFYIFDSGSVYNITGTYGTISDVKLKENIVDATPKLDDVMQLQVRNFNFKATPEEKHIGFIAQEFEQVFPSMVDVDVERDENGEETGQTTKTIKTSVLLPVLVKAIQELKAEVDALKGQA